MQDILQKYSKIGLIIDTNLLLLYLVGIYDVNLITNFKRTAKYTSEDFNIIDNFLKYFNKVITTPYILSELSNLSLQIKEPKKKDYFIYLIKVLKQYYEEHIAKDTILDSRELYLLPQIGFTDLSIIEAVKKNEYLVFTDDFKLTGYLQSLKFDVINLNHIRTSQWLSSH